MEKKWTQNDKGNWWALTKINGEKKFITVFQQKNGRDEGRWKFVCDEEFSEEAYDDEEEAMEAAEDVYP